MCPCTPPASTTTSTTLLHTLTSTTPLHYPSGIMRTSSTHSFHRSQPITRISLEQACELESKRQALKQSLKRHQAFEKTLAERSSSDEGEPSRGFSRGLIEKTLARREEKKRERSARKLKARNRPPVDPSVFGDHHPGRTIHTTLPTIPDLRETLPTFQEINGFYYDIDWSDSFGSQENEDVYMVSEETTAWAHLVEHGCEDFDGPPQPTVEQGGPSRASTPDSASTSTTVATLLWDGSDVGSSAADTDATSVGGDKECKVV